MPHIPDEVSRGIQWDRARTGVSLGVRTFRHVTSLPDRKAHVGCRWCGGRLACAGRGRPRQYCRPSCRQRAYEQRKIDRAAAAVGAWLDWTRQELMLARDQLDELESYLDPAEISLRPRRRRAAPRFACPSYGRFTGDRVDTISEWRDRPLLGPPPPERPRLDTPSA